MRLNPDARPLKARRCSFNPWRNARHHEQLRDYTPAGRGEGLTVDAAYFHEPRDGTRRAVDISEGACRGAFEEVSNRLGRLRQGQFAALPEAVRCRGCEYREICGDAPTPG